MRNQPQVRKSDRRTLRAGGQLTGAPMTRAAPSNKNIRSAIPEFTDFLCANGSLLSCLKVGKEQSSDGVLSKWGAIPGALLVEIESESPTRSPGAGVVRWPAHVGGLRGTLDVLAAGSRGGR